MGGIPLQFTDFHIQHQSRVFFGDYRVWICSSEFLKRHCSNSFECHHNFCWSWYIVRLKWFLTWGIHWFEESGDFYIRLRTKLWDILCLIVIYRRHSLSIRRNCRFSSIQFRYIPYPCGTELTTFDGIFLLGELFLHKLQRRI